MYALDIDITFVYFDLDMSNILFLEVDSLKPFSRSGCSASSCRFSTCSSVNACLKKEFKEKFEPAERF